MIERSTIRDNSAQDHVVTTASPRQRSRRQWLLFVGTGAAVVLVIAWLFAGWSAGSQSVDSARVRIAEVKRGDLVRDISADGRVIAANSPTLYAIAGGTVTLKVVAGDKVAKGQPLAEIDIPELRSKLAQEQAMLASLEGEARRAVLDAQLARSSARKLLDQATIERQAALRDLERYQRGFDGGAVARWRRSMSPRRRTKSRKLAWAWRLRAKSPKRTAAALPCSTAKAVVCAYRWCCQIELTL